MKYLLISDIWGRTPELELLATKFSRLGETEILDPYSGEFQGFSTEQQAYHYFTDNIGLESYANLLQNKLDSEHEPLCLIGFSVGASAIWLISKLYNQAKVAGALCLYSSQIRHSLHIEPDFPISLVFPQQEPHFDVNAVIETIENFSSAGNVSCTKLPYLHGFLNQCSPNVNQTGYQRFVESIEHFPANTPIHQLTLS